MKKAVRITTVIATLLIMAGGSALDSKDILVPVATIIPALVWYGLIAWANM